MKFKLAALSCGFAGASTLALTKDPMLATGVLAAWAAVVCLGACLDQCAREGSDE